MLLESKLNNFYKKVCMLQLEASASGGAGLALMDAVINEVMSVLCAIARLCSTRPR